MSIDGTNGWNMLAIMGVYRYMSRRVTSWWRLSDKMERYCAMSLSDISTGKDDESLAPRYPRSTMEEDALLRMGMLDGVESVATKYRIASVHCGNLRAHHVTREFL